MTKKVKLVLNINGLKIKSSGKNLSDAIDALNPPFFKSKGILCVEKDGQKAEKVLPIPMMRKLFGVSPMMKGIVVKNLEMLLKYE